jgi:hypothetical protein
MPENTLARLNLEAINNFSRYSGETVIDIWIRTVDYRKCLVGIGRRGVIADSKYSRNESFMTNYARKQANAPGIVGFNSFSGHSDETVVEIWIRTVDYRKGVVGRGRCDVIADSNYLSNESFMSNYARKPVT